MTRYLPIVVLILIVSTIACDAAPITYQITPRAGDTLGWGILGGEIVTDGTLGALQGENFLDWRIEIASPVGSSTLTSNNSDIYATTLRLMENPSPSLVASPSELVLGGSDGEFTILYFATNDFITSGEPSARLISFHPGQTPAGWEVNVKVGELVDNRVDPSEPYTMRNRPNRNTSTFSSSSHSVLIGTVATVPEPSSVCIAAAASIVGLVLVSVRRRKSKTALS